jgi:uncharacterized protein (DUF1778 family)
MPRQPTHTDPRIPPATPRAVKRAAAIQGRAIQLSLEDQRRFVDLLVNPSALAPALKRAKSAHSRLIAS